MTDINIVLWEDFSADEFYPLTLTRPVFHLRAGAFSFHERAQFFFQPKSVFGVCRSNISPVIADEGIFTDLDSIDGKLPTLFLNGRAFVGQKILKIIKLPIGKLIIAEEEDDEIQ